MPRRPIAALLLTLAFGPAASAQTGDMVGKWLLGFDFSSEATGSQEQLLLLGMDPSAGLDYGVLEIENDGEETRVFIDGGPVNLLLLDGNSITFDMDWTDSRDILHITELSGSLENGQLSGTMAEEGEPTGTWFATAWTEHPDAGAPPDPIDLTGVWVSLSRGTHKDSFDLSEEGARINAAYDPIYDDPHLRCVSGGIIRMEDGPFAQEYIQRDDELLILYQYFHEVRRVWVDGREFPEGIEDAYLSNGYSIGRWEGSTLVIETRGMKPTIWDSTGMPTSPSAVVIERKYLDELGRLHTDTTLHDSVNYNRPVYRHAYRERSETAVLGESACDPHSFFRGLDLEGRLPEYWQRGASRF